MCSVILKYKWTKIEAFYVVVTNNYTDGSCLYSTIFLCFTESLSYAFSIFDEVGNVHPWEKKQKMIIIVGLEFLVSRYCSFLYFNIPVKTQCSNDVKLYT